MPTASESEPRGRIVLAGTPLGNAADASQRLREVLAAADVIAAEDTRRLRNLLSRIDVVITGRVVSFFEGNERSRAGELIEAAQRGDLVVVVTDAGMPSVSDPGYSLVVAALAAGVPISVVPGPSAVITALAVSGLPVDRFTFEGFLPRKSGERRAALTTLVTEPRTMVFFEAPHRVEATLVEMAAVFGSDRGGAVCRELTKTYEQVIRGTLAELVTAAKEGLRGEITLVIAGAAPDAGVARSDEELVAEVLRLEQAGISRKDAIAEVAASFGAKRRLVYDAVIRLRADA